MDFGKLSDISGVDFTLPADNPLTEKVLTLSDQAMPLQIYVGLPLWADKSWKGKLYPQSADDKKFLYHYSRQFNSIELNQSLYRMPDVPTFNKWKTDCPPGFKFFPKFHQSISHERKLIGAEVQTAEFCNAVFSLGDKLGRAFLQMSESYQPNQLKNLEKFLKSLSPALPVSVELRHEKWFEPGVWQDTCGMLQSLGVGTVISDVAGRRDALHMALTTNHLLLRFTGNDLHPTDYSRADDWCVRIVDWIKKGLKNIYIFIHCHDNTFAPELALYWIKKLNELGGLRIQEPRLTPQVVQGSLF